MKVVSTKQMTLVESSMYQTSSSESELMESAGSGIALVAHSYIESYDLNPQVILLCGKGNNAGDAYVAGVHLIKLGYEVISIQTFPIPACSPLCQQNYHRFLAEGGRVEEVQQASDIDFPIEGLILDGLFGTGLQGPVKGPIGEIIDAINASKQPIIAIDIPSGLNGNTGRTEGPAIHATLTAFLGLPKTGLFLNDAWNYIGRLCYVDIGLSEDSVQEAQAELIMITPDLLHPLLPPIIRNRHKYQRGYVVGLAGSPGMPGAAILSSTSALNGGAGIVRLLHQKGMEAELSTSPPEIIRQPYDFQDAKGVIQALNKASAVFIGPGMGRGPESQRLLKQILPAIEKPCVIDADALFLLAQEDIALPKQTILTPHHGEMARLLHQEIHPVLDMDFLKTCQSYAEQKQATIVLKGAPTFILQAKQMIFVNPLGDPGMATAGSGDVLTGLIAALLAQGLPAHNAATLGVFLHALAGEHAASNRTSYCMIASDIIEYFPEAFLFRPSIGF